MNLCVEKIDHEDPAVREKVYEFLAPHEPYCLFITGNLKMGFPGSHLYVARRGVDWLGVAGYYAGPKSLIPFSPEPEAVRVLIRHVAENHPVIDYLNAIASVAEPACDELRRLGYEITGDPRQIFMQLEGEPVPQPHQGLARLMTTADHRAVAGLLRYLRGEPPKAPVTDEEVRRIGLNPLRYVLVADGQVVSTAATNGVGISAFQILAVATHQGHRNKGYARAVCAALIRAMRKKGARQTIIFTGRGNAAALRCYEKLGFQATGEYWVAKVARATQDG